jgi:mannose-6-phosphate isomerase-like protein (cupin superfamily)
MYVKNLEEAEPFECAGIQFGMILPRDVTKSVEVVWERLEPSMGTPPDRHSGFDQLFFILKGTGAVTVGTETRQVKPATVVFIPRATEHSVQCTSNEGFEYLFFNVWSNGLPDEERDWKAVYTGIHDRRFEDQLTK